MLPTVLFIENYQGKFFFNLKQIFGKSSSLVVVLLGTYIGESSTENLISISITIICNVPIRVTSGHDTWDKLKLKMLLKNQE